VFLITPIKISGYTQHCSNSFCEAHLKPLPQLALTSTSNCIHEEDGKYVMLPTQYAKYALWQDISDSLLSNTARSIFLSNAAPSIFLLAPLQA